MPQRTRLPVLFIVGPTASGKSALARSIAEMCHGEIINFDARQIYQHARIGTAAPGPEEQQPIPHHLYNFLPPQKRFSAGAFEHRSARIIVNVIQRGHLPILVGGTGLYFRAARHGLLPAPGPTPYRARLEQRLQREGPSSLYQELQSVDPDSAERIHPGDGKRIVRALEIYYVTGRPMSEFRKHHAFKTRRYFDRVIGLMPPRSRLKLRIHHRTEQMFADGWIDEVRDLLERGTPLDAPVFDAIGYRPIAEAIVRSQINTQIPNLIERITRETYHYARAQMKWFRREPDILWFHDPPDQSILISWIRPLLRALQPIRQKPPHETA